MATAPFSISDAQIDQTVGTIAATQLPDGCIPWFAGGQVDPWNLVEAAMALDVGGRHDQAAAAYRWLAQMQRPDGWWHAYYFSDGEVKDPTRDANAAAYIAVGAWHHLLSTGDWDFFAAMWPVVARAIDAVLELQAPGGEVSWAMDTRGNSWPKALVASSSCIHLSLRCAIAAAEVLGDERPDWELSAGSLRDAVAHRPEAFEVKDRWSMDWYYPVLGGVLEGEAAQTRILERWDTFVVDGLGTRCVSDQRWVTAAETCELVIALEASGMRDRAIQLFDWVQHLRADDGAYWTGATYPDREWYPQEQSTWTAAAVVLAADALRGTSRASGLFRGEGLPMGVDVPERVVERLRRP